MSPGARPWLQHERSQLASERILDAAADLYRRHGVAETSMEDVARAAGCSRATVYRYFDDREALRLAFVHRETRRIGAIVAESIAGLDDPRQRVTEGVLRAVAEVRSRPNLLAWFAAPTAEITSEIAGRSPVILHLAASLVAGDGHPDQSDRASWLVRSVLSLLMIPGADAGEERRLVAGFVAPPVAPTV